jgi:hypothetical protein
MRDLSLENAMKIAVDCTVKAIKLTDTSPRMGVRFEVVLGEYERKLTK